MPAPSNAGDTIPTDSCKELRDGSVQCWGDNYYGELGIGIPMYSAVPVTVTGF